MAKSSLELDIFHMGRRSDPRTFERKTSFRGSKTSFRDIQGLVSKINPDVLKRVIGKGCVDAKKSSLCSPPTTSPKEKVPSFPVYDPTLRLSNRFGEKAETAPLTIFYNGRVAIFEVSPHKAQDIMKLAEKTVLHKSAESPPSKPAAQYLPHAPSGDFPITRRKSLQSFLEKRKERLVQESPYWCVSARRD